MGCFLGIAIGLLISFLGFLVTTMDIGTATTDKIGEDIKFGADFYTEMYDVTKDVGKAVNNVTKEINDAIDKICTAIGMLIFSIGLLDIAFFTYKILSTADSATTKHNVNYTTHRALDKTNNVSKHDFHVAPDTSKVQNNMPSSDNSDQWPYTQKTEHNDYKIDYRGFQDRR